jgi:mRNA-degrading endonuclease RelE of RelBE toxin-antitoxin system
LMQQPNLAALVPGSGGVRKARWGQPGRGKRGGIRVIYYVQGREGVIWMLTIYAKNEERTIPAHVLRKIKEEIDG